MGEWSRKALVNAKREAGVSEVPRGSNLGPKVNVYKSYTWLNPTKAWPWCVAFVQYIIFKTFGERFPLACASVEEFASFSRKNNLHIPFSQAARGDIVCLGGEHITFFDGIHVPGTFKGFGGNQGDMVKLSMYPSYKATTIVSMDKIAAFLDIAPPVKKRRPLYEVVKGEEGKTVVFVSRDPRAISAKVLKMLKNGYKNIRIRKKA